MLKSDRVKEILRNFKQPCVSDRAENLVEARNIEDVTADISHKKKVLHIVGFGTFSTCDESNAQKSAILTKNMIMKKYTVGTIELM